jgi:DNA-binding GntR family transcriptional regulator
MCPLVIRKRFKAEYPPSLVGQTTEFLTDSIIEGRLAGGKRLVESGLQRQFGISRGPIREAFRILERNGLVITVPRKGTFVRTITKENVKENFPVRACLEGLAAKMAVSHLTQEHIKELDLALSKMIDGAKKDDFKYYFKHHRKFHEIFIHASQNDTLIGILENLRRQALWFRFWHQENVEYATRVHREILDLFIKKDADRVEVLVKEHILIALDRTLQFFASK